MNSHELHTEKTYDLKAKYTKSELLGCLRRLSHLGGGNLVEVINSDERFDIPVNKFSRFVFGELPDKDATQGIKALDLVCSKWPMLYSYAANITDDPATLFGVVVTLNATMGGPFDVKLSADPEPYLLILAEIFDRCLRSDKDLYNLLYLMNECLSVVVE